jgi:hypothetical protein
MFHKYHLLNQIASFHEIQKITKMSFNIPLIQLLLIILFILACLIRNGL